MIPCPNCRTWFATQLFPLMIQLLERMRQIVVLFPVEALTNAKFGTILAGDVFTSKLELHPVAGP
jgi:hypothetical protein